MGFLSFLMNNVWAKWVAIGGVIYVIMRTKEEVDERRGYRRAVERTEKQARRVQEKVRETLDEKSSQTADARDSVRADIRATGRLPDNLRKQWVSDYADSGGS